MLFSFYIYNILYFVIKIHLYQLYLDNVYSQYFKSFTFLMHVIYLKLNDIFLIMLSLSQFYQYDQ